MAMSATTTVMGRLQSGQDETLLSLARLREKRLNVTGGGGDCRAVRARR